VRQVLHGDHAARGLVLADQREKADTGAIGVLELLGELLRFQLHLGVEAGGAQLGSDLQRFAQAREISQRAISAWRTVLLAPPDRRAQMLAELELPSSLSATLDDAPIARPELPPMPPPIARLLRLDLFANSPPRFRPREVITAWLPGGPSFAASLRLPSGEWLNLRIHLPPPRPWHSETFLIAFAAMTFAALLWPVFSWAMDKMRGARAVAV